MTRTILITGASSGIGRATARLFRERGWNVVATMRAPDAAAAPAETDSMMVTRLDVTDADSIAEAVAVGNERFGAIDAVLNNAGYGCFGVVEAVSMEQVRRNYETNVIGAVAVTKAVLPQMRARGDGTVVNVSSMGGVFTQPLTALFNSAKFALEGLTEGMHYELGPAGIRVRLIQPGVVQTDFGGRSLEYHNDRSMEAYQPLVKTVLGELAKLPASGSPPEKVAETIWDAVEDTSDRLRYVVGSDAVEILRARKKMEDGRFFARIRKQYGL